MDNENQKRTTGRPRIEERDPLRAARAIECYAETGSLNAVSKTTGLPRSTVKAILTRQPHAFDMVKRVIAQRAAVLAETCLEHAQKNAKRLTPYQAVIGAKVSTDHMLLALGREAGPVVNIDLGGIQEVMRRNEERRALIAELRALRARLLEERAAGAAGALKAAEQQPEAEPGEATAPDAGGAVPRLVSS